MGRFLRRKQPVAQGSRHQILILVDVPGNPTYTAVVPWGSDWTLEPESLQAVVKHALHRAAEVAEDAEVPLEARGA